MSRITIIALMIALILCLTASPKTLGGDINDIRRELIIRFNDTIVVMPQGVDSAGKEIITLKSSASGHILDNSNLSHFLRAFKDHNPADSFAINEFGDTILKPRLDGYFKVIFPDSISRNNVFNSLIGSADILEMVKNGDVCSHSFIEPNDPKWYEQWNLKHDSVFGINAVEAWEYTTGNSDVIVAVIDDEGVWHDHNDLYPRVMGDIEWSGYHGTGVAGVIGAMGNNEIATAGICWQCKLYAGNVAGFDIEDICNTTIAAVNNGSHIINNSWGSPSFVSAWRKALAYAYKMNVLTVCSKGNNSSSEPNYPSDFGQGIISVGAYGHQGRWMDYSNTGNGIDIVAPGDGIFTTGTDNINDFYIGSRTSFAAPHAAGVAALLKSYDNSLYNDDIENIINLTAKDNTYEPATEGYDNYTGWGNLNAKAAFDILQPPNILSRLDVYGGSEHSHTDFLGMIFYDVPDMTDGGYFARRYEVRKSITFSHPYFTPPHVWGRGVASKGYSAVNPNFGMNYVGVIPESITETGCVLRTWVYDVWTVSGIHVGWKPCAPEYVEFAYTCLGEFELSSSPYISCTNHYDHQSIKVCFEDHNPYEEGWIIERKIATSQSWQVIDTIPNNPDQYFYYEDYYPIGSETYTYRVKPFTSNQQNVAYSNEVTITARPRWPENLVAYATNCFNGIPANPGCNAAVPKMLSAKTTTGEPEPDTLDDGSYPDSYLANDITARWSYPSNQKYPIVKYIVKKCNTLGSPLKSWALTGDTCLYVCPNQTDMSFQMNVYSVASNGDTSLPATRGVRTGNINICPGNITKDFDDNQVILPAQAALYQNCPNPFNLSTEIRFCLAEPKQVSIDIYDLLGRKIVTLIDQVFESGEHSILWDGRDTDGSEAASGIYFYRIKAGEYTETRKMMMLK